MKCSLEPALLFQTRQQQSAEWEGRCFRQPAQGALRYKQWATGLSTEYGPRGDPTASHREAPTACTSPVGRGWGGSKAAAEPGPGRPCDVPLPVLTHLPSPTSPVALPLLGNPCCFLSKSGKLWVWEVPPVPGKWGEEAHNFEVTVSSISLLKYNLHKIKIHFKRTYGVFRRVQTVVPNHHMEPPKAPPGPSAMSSLPVTLAPAND